jgi:hypothetical protein
LQLSSAQFADGTAFQTFQSHAGNNPAHQFVLFGGVVLITL